ncbi:cytochrome P450 family protein [Herbidospora mongoliensis]|uniref:cytochrome P450 family protein n=1 Tax=Herbidospora mongoliensis TaxID=688067 RepID=UPI000831C5BB|nr:cytochrome P450 [Herbidospora mongoliensis]
MSHGLPELGDEYLRDPHGVYRALRDEGPVVQVVMPNGLRMWLITRYDDAREALTDPRLRKDAATIREAVQRAATTPDARIQPAELASHMLNSDPPDHTRLRKLVSKAFTPRAIELLRPRVEEITAGLLDRMDGDVDLIDAFAYPLPMTVICELLGVPERDRDELRALMHEVLSSPFRTGDDHGERERRVARVVERFVALIEEKRANPADDILSALVQARDQEDKLDEVELISTCFLLFLAGHETTVNLIGNAVLALLTHPDQRIELLKNPDVIDRAVEEFLRYDGPLNFAPQRVTGEDVTIAGVTIPKGELVAVALSSADRDPATFREPDRLDLDREDAPHLAFGHGIHYCLGAPLARLEARIALARLFERFPEMSLGAQVEELQWRRLPLLHALEHLPVRLRPDAG